MVPELWGKPLWEKVWPFLDPWDSVRPRTASTQWNVPGKYGPHGELFFSSKRSRGGVERGAARSVCLCGNAQSVCALIGLHLFWQQKNEAGSSGSQSPDLRDKWRYGCPKSPDWDSVVESWTESEGTSSSEQCEYNAESLAVSGMGQDQLGEKISLFSEDWELGRGRRWRALSCHVALDMLCQEVHEAW